MRSGRPLLYLIRVVFGLTIAGMFVPTCLADPSNSDIVAGSVDSYRELLVSILPDRGELYCETGSADERFAYDSCETFFHLKNQGCYGYSTQDLRTEEQYKSLCELITALDSAQDTKVHYFSMGSADWWRSLPAEIIPLSGGLYNDESLQEATAAREQLVHGKDLGDLRFLKVEADRIQFAATIDVEELDCGEIHDRIKITAKLLADFDSDGVAELLLEGHRVHHSAGCWLGSGNSLGASFNTLVKKKSPNAQMELIDVSEVESAGD